MSELLTKEKFREACDALMKADRDGWQEQALLAESCFYQTSKRVDLLDRKLRQLVEDLEAALDIDYHRDDCPLLEVKIVDALRKVGPPYYSEGGP